MQSYTIGASFTEKQQEKKSSVRRPFPSSSGFSWGLRYMCCCLCSSVTGPGLRARLGEKWKVKKKGSPSKSPAHRSLFPRPLAEKKVFLLEFLLSVLAAQFQNSACPQVNSREKRKIKIHESHPLWILNSSFHFNSQYTWYVYFSKSLGGGFLYSVVSFSCNQWKW